MKLLSIEYIPGVEFEPLGIVKGTVVQTKNVGRDFMAGMKTLVVGEIVGYTEMLNEARQIATKRMVDEAKEMDADAVIGVKYGSSQVMAGAAVMILLMLITIVIVFWANTQDPIPLGMLLLIAGIPAVIIVGTLVALAGRMKEIEGGEEDEASKY